MHALSALLISIAAFVSGIPGPDDPAPRPAANPEPAAPAAPAEAPSPAPAPDAPAPDAPAAAEPAAPKAAGADAALPFPHPIIVEVLYAVPTADGDANGDGRRHVSGDEFVELYNPHDKPIQLRGYKLTDSNPPDKGQVRFVFPVFELPPGGVVVLFNGFQCSWFGPVGDEKAPPAATNDRFGEAWVFTMKAPSQYVAFSNSGDHVLLTAPDGSAVHRVSWGEPKDRAAFDKIEPLLDDVAPQASKGSVQRDGLARVAAFRSHLDLPFAHGGDKPFSPGLWKPLPEPKKPSEPESTPTTAPSEAVPKTPAK